MNIRNSSSDRKLPQLLNICVISFLSMKGVKSADIHFQTSEMYEQNITSGWMVRMYVDRGDLRSLLLIQHQGTPVIHAQSSNPSQPSDYHVFLHFKKHVGRRGYNTDDENVKVPVLLTFTRMTFGSWLHDTSTLILVGII